MCEAPATTLNTTEGERLAERDRGKVQMIPGVLKECEQGYAMWGS